MRMWKIILEDDIGWVAEVTIEAEYATDAMDEAAHTAPVHWTTMSAVAA